jgi:hypothetical protein
LSSKALTYPIQFLPKLIMTIAGQVWVISKRSYTAGISNLYCRPFVLGSVLSALEKRM